MDSHQRFTEVRGENPRLKSWETITSEPERRPETHGEALSEILDDERTRAIVAALKANGGEFQLSELIDAVNNPQPGIISTGEMGQRVLSDRDSSAYLRLWRLRSLREPLRFLHSASWKQEACPHGANGISRERVGQGSSRPPNNRNHFGHLGKPKTYGGRPHATRGTSATRVREVRRGSRHRWATCWVFDLLPRLHSFPSGLRGASADSEVLGYVASVPDVRYPDGVPSSLGREVRMWPIVPVWARTCRVG